MTTPAAPASPRRELTPRVPGVDRTALVAVEPPVPLRTGQEFPTHLRVEASWARMPACRRTWRSPTTPMPPGLCAEDYRVGFWGKTFAVHKPGLPVAYASEPVIFRGGRKRGRHEPAVKDRVACPITLERGLTGAEPRDFRRWMFDLLGASPGHALDGFFPGSGAVGAAWAEWAGERSPLPRLPLEGSA